MPSPPAPFAAAGLQYLLPATWTAIKFAGGDLATLTRVLSTEPAKLIGAENTKGEIQAGYDADLVVSVIVLGSEYKHWQAQHTLLKTAWHACGFVCAGVGP